MSISTQNIKNPAFLFLFFAVPYGIILILLLPPLGGNDEGFHFQRIATIAYNQPFNEPVAAAAGIKKFMEAGSNFFTSDLHPPFHYSWKEFDAVKSISLDKDKSIILKPNYFTVHHPFCYIPQIIAFKIGLILNINPLFILYFCRIASFGVSIFITYKAIQITPSHKYFLTALGFLPVALFYRSAINPDGFTNGLAFLFCAVIYREYTLRTTLSIRKISFIAMLGFILAQCKNAYMPLLFLTLALPAQCFYSKKHRFWSFLAIIMPALIASIVWIVLAKESYFSGISYHTWGGNANPDMQIQYILHNPFAFMLTMLRTLFTTLFFYVAFIQIFSDVGIGDLMYIGWVLPLFYLFFATVLSEKNSIIFAFRGLAASIFLASFTLILTLLYIHWDSVGADEIIGFHGRYLYTLLPLAIPFIRISGKSLISGSCDTYLLLLAIIATNGAVWQVIQNNY